MTILWKANADPSGKPIWTFEIAGKKYNDPVQGTNPTDLCCALQAALSAIAWTNTAMFKIYPYNAYFNTPCSGEPRIVKVDFADPAFTAYVTDTLPWDDVANEFPWAHAKDLNEIWPAVYEKAFISYRGYVKDLETGTNIYQTAGFYPSSCDAPIDDPNWLGQPINNPPIPWGGNPVTTLHNLSAGREKTTVDVAGYTADDIFPIISDKCTTTGCGTSKNYEHRRTLNNSTYGYYAMVGMTYPSNVKAPLKDNHSYTILGVVKDLYGPDHFIVVRDPLAVDLSKYPNSPTIFCPLYWKIPCDGTAGVLAVPISEFVAGFIKLGWIKY